MALDLAINDLDAGYGAVKALRGVSLRVAAGETVALLGTNGNGKSTLMKCIAGLVRPQRGSISLTIDGVVHDLSRLSTEEIVELGVVMVPEGRRLFPRLTVLENLQMGAFTRSDPDGASSPLGWASCRARSRRKAISSIANSRSCVSFSSVKKLSSAAAIRSRG